jgi:hypothetical protein
VIIAVAFVFLDAEFAAADIDINSIGRLTSTSATGGVPQSYVVNGTGGPYNATFTTIGVLPAANTLSTDATQSSFTPNLVGPFMTGSGAVGATAATDGAISYNASASSVLDVFFTVTESQTYALEVGVSWTHVDSAFTGQSRIFLVGGDVSYEVMHDSAAPGTASDVRTFSLVPSVGYRLRANASILGNGDTAGTFSAEGSWNFSLYPVSVPEPTTTALLAVGLIPLLTSANRRRR